MKPRRHSGGDGGGDGGGNGTEAGCPGSGGDGGGERPGDVDGGEASGGEGGGAGGNGEEGGGAGGLPALPAAGEHHTIVAWSSALRQLTAAINRSSQESKGHMKFEQTTDYCSQL
jgi:hypothetical protein